MTNHLKRLCQKKCDLTLDMESGMVTLSEGACKILEMEGFIWTIGELTERMLPEYRDNFTKVIDQAIEKVEPFDYECVILRPSEEQPVNLHLSGYYDPKKKTVFSVMQDITESKRAESEKNLLQEQLNQSQKMESVGRLAGGVAHDFNNMLQLIIGHAEIAISQMNSQEAIYEDVEEILNAAKRSAELTKQLLAFARKQTYSPRPLDLNETVTDMQKMFKRIIGENIELIWHPGSGLWKVKMDPVQVNQILANIIVNARDAIEKNGAIIIETSNVTVDETIRARKKLLMPGQYVLLSISDTGSGMDKEVLEHLFEPFFTTKEVGKGTGLGLATVYGIVQQNNGIVDVYSEKGKGTVFKIYLPNCLEKAEIVEHDRSSSGDVRGAETVLIVEDEEAIMKLTKRALESNGYTVITISNPNEAIEQIGASGTTVDLLITDVIMPKMNGKQLADEICKLVPSAEVLFMSGYPAEVIVKQGSIEENVNFIQKPFSIRDFTGKVRNVLDNRNK